MLFVFVIYKSSFLQIPTLQFPKHLGLFTLKIVGAFSLYWVYTSIYPNRETADIFKHFDDALAFYRHVYSTSIGDYLNFLVGRTVDSPEMTEALIHTKYWLRQTEIGTIGDNHVLIKTHAILLLFSQGFYPIHLLFFAFIAYIGSTIFYRFIVSFFTPSTLLLFGIFIIPSELFFCSGTLKETLILFFISVILYSSYHLTKKFKYTHLLLVITLILSTYLLVILKVYVLIALIPGLTSFLLFSRLKTNYWGLFTMLIHAVYILLLFTLPNIDFIGNLQFKQHDLILVAREMHAGSSIELPLLDAQISTYIYAIPSTLKNVFTLPHPSSSNTVWMWLSTLENYAVIGLLLASCFKLKDTNRLQRQYLTMIISFSLLLALFIGWTVPITGAIVRYKVIFIALLIPSLIAILKNRKREL